MLRGMVTKLTKIIGGEERGYRKLQNFGFEINRRILIGKVHLIGLRESKSGTVNSTKFFSYCVTAL